MGADVGWRSRHTKEHFHFKASWIRKYFRLALNQQSYREKALAVMPPVMRICARARRSGLDSSSARTVTETATAYATVL